MMYGLGALFDSIKRQRRDAAKAASGDQNYEYDLSLDDTLKMDQKEINDAIESNSSSHDKFFDDRHKTSNLREAFDSFAEVVLLDDKTEVNFDQLDDELSNAEHYD